MICRNCEKELPEGSVLCCFCGTPVEETVEQPVEVIAQSVPEESLTESPTPKKKGKIWILILAIVAGIALLAVLVGAVLYGMGIDPIELLKPRSNDIFCREDYYVEDEKAREKAEQVVATLGDRELTNGELQIYYWETVYGFINDNYYYLSMYGLDLNKPLSQQVCMFAEDQTWQQYFLEIALSTWQRYNTLQLLAEDDGFQVDTEMQAFLDDLPNSMQTNAAKYGFDTVQEWLEDSCGAGVTQDGYINYVTAYYKGTFYLTDRYDEMQPTQEEVEAFFTENEAELAASGVTKDMGKYYNVRHILIEIEGGTKDENGNVTYSDADWEACRAEAQALLDQWKTEDGTEEGFAEYAKQYSADGGSGSNGGLYENLTASTNFVTEFKDWYLDESRQVGDTGLVRSVYGYHIMYFSSSREMWLEVVAEELLSERISDMIDEGMEIYPMETKYKKIVLGDQDLA